MAIAVNVLHAATGDTNAGSAASITTASAFTPSANSLVLPWVRTGHATSANTVTTSVSAGTNYTSVATLVAAGGSPRITLFRMTTASPVSHTITFSPSASQVATGYVYGVIELTDVDVSGGSAGAVVQSDTAEDSGTTFDAITLSAFADVANATVLALGGGNAALSMESGWTAISTASHATPTGHGAIAWKLGNDTTPTATSAGSVGWVGIAVEVKVAAAGFGTLQGVYGRLVAGDVVRRVEA